MLISFPNIKTPALPGPRRMSPGTDSSSSLPAALQMLRLLGLWGLFPLPRSSTGAGELQPGLRSCGRVSPLGVHLGHSLG